MQGPDLLVNFLVESGLVSRSQLESLSPDKPVSVALIESGIMSEDELRRAQASALGIPFIVLERDIDPKALSMIPEPLSRAKSIVAYSVSGSVVEVALLNIEDLSAIDFLKHQNYTIKPRLTTRESIKRALFGYQQALRVMFGAALKGAASTEEALKSLIDHALHQRAFGVHLMLGHSGLLVRYRIEGMMHDAMTLGNEIGGKLVEKIKQLASIVGEKEEGRFKFNRLGDHVVVRAAANKTVNGQKMTLRLFPEAEGPMGYTLESLGFHGEGLEYMHELLHARNGLIFISGTKQSGKTTTLYTILDQLHRHAVTTVEDHIAVRLPYASQTPISNGVSMLAAFRATLRHDPDVVMLDSIKDNDTLELALRSSQRMMVAVGVEEDAYALIEKLQAFNAPHMLDKVKTIVQVRVAKKLCERCKRRTQLTRAQSRALEEAGVDFGLVLAALKKENLIDKHASWKELTFFGPGSCSQCSSGYKGYIGVEEILPLSGERHLSLLEDGLFKAFAGKTSLEEVAAL